jgi:3-methylfumaryl-CoA hydratase
MNNFVERTDTPLPEPAHSLGGLLRMPVPDLAQDDGLPLTWHSFYLLDRPAQGSSAHPQDGPAVLGADVKRAPHPL